MSTITSPRPVAKRTEATWGAIFYRAGGAVGTEGRLVDAGTVEAVELWRGQSAYVASLLRTTVADRTRWLLVAAEVLAVGSGSFTIGGVALDLGDVLYPLAATAGVAAYAFAARWVARQPHRSWLLWTAERVRRVIAYEGDPGPMPR
jgi:hypothetical protein